MTLRDIASKPLNNLSGAYFAVGEELDPRFGGNCISKSLEVVDACEKYSSQESVLENAYTPLSVQTLIAAKTHRACLISEVCGRQFFYDPSFYMDRPVLISDDLLSEEIEASCVNPCSLPAVFYSDVTLFGATNDFKLCWSVVTPYRDHEYTYKYNVNKRDLVLPTPDAADKNRVAPPSLFIRFLNLEDGFLYCAQYMSFTGRIIIKPHFTSKIYYLDENSCLVKSLISQMESSLNLTELQIRDFFTRSAEVFKEAKHIWNSSTLSKKLV